MTAPLRKPAQATLSDHRVVHRPVSRKVDFAAALVGERVAANISQTTFHQSGDRATALQETWVCKKQE